MIAARLEILALPPLRAGDPLLRWLGEELRGRFGFAEVVPGELEIRREWLEPGSAPGGELRLSSNRVVDALVDRAAGAGASHHDGWTLAVTSLDLATPSRDYVFGEATLGGGWALVSCARLASPGEGPPHGDHRVRRRLLAEAVHELGHLAGLAHCPRHPCVMHPAPDVPDIDARGLEFCAECDGLRLGA